MEYLLHTLVLLKNPHSIPELTYKEMRELAYAGFSVLHDEALVPAYRGKISSSNKKYKQSKSSWYKNCFRTFYDHVTVVGIAGDSGL